MAKRIALLVGHHQPRRGRRWRSRRRRSRDYGWELATPTDSPTRLRGLSAVSERVAWTSGSLGTVLRTTNRGATWDSVGPPGTEALQFRDIEAFSRSTAVILSIGNGHRLVPDLPDDERRPHVDTHLPERGSTGVLRLHDVLRPASRARALGPGRRLLPDPRDGRRRPQLGGRRRRHACRRCRSSSPSPRAASASSRAATSRRASATATTTTMTTTTGRPGQPTRLVRDGGDAIRARFPDARRR